MPRFILEFHGAGRYTIHGPGGPYECNETRRGFYGIPGLVDPEVWEDPRQAVEWLEENIP